MRAHDLARLLALAALWSLQFMFMRVAVPVFGTAAVAEGRALSAALFLLPAAALLGQRVGLAAHWKDHLIVALPNNVLPFLCFAWAATALPAGYLAIVNGTVPLWTGVLAAWLLGEPLGARRLVGFVLGLVAVTLTVNLGPIEIDARTLAATGAALLGAASWAYGGVAINLRSGVPPVGLAAGSITWAAVLLSPLWALAPAPSAWTGTASAALLALGIVCSGVAYLLSFRLMREVGASRTLSTGLIVPALGVLWGWLFLDEVVTVPMLVGAALVPIALALVLKR